MTSRLRLVTCLTLALAGTFAAAPLALGAGAEAITVVERHVDVNPGELNTCSGATGTIVNDEQDVFHITSLADGTLSLTGHSTAAVTFLPDDPNAVRYEGHETFAFSENGTGAALTTTMTTTVRVKGTDGSFITIREVAHLTATASGVVVAFDRLMFLCS